MRLAKSSVLFLLLSTALGACGSAPDASTTLDEPHACEGTSARDIPTGRDLGTMTTIERRIFDLTNDQRARAGLPRLKAVSHLVYMAQKHSINQARKREMNHILDGKRPRDRANSAGYVYAGIYENIAAGANYTAESVVQAWMNSPGHKENVLRRGISQLGVGVHRGGDGKLYFTQNFGHPQSGRCYY